MIEELITFNLSMSANNLNYLKLPFRTSRRLSNWVGKAWVDWPWMLSMALRGPLSV